MKTDQVLESILKALPETKSRAAEARLGLLDRPRSKSGPGVVDDGRRSSSTTTSSASSTTSRSSASASSPAACAPSGARRRAARASSSPDHRDYSAGRRLPVPRLERLSALRSAAPPPLRRGRGPPPSTSSSTASARWAFGDGEKLRSGASARARRSRTWGSRTSIASRIVVDHRQACSARMPATRGKARIFKVFRFLNELEAGRSHRPRRRASKTFVAQNKRRGLVVLASDLYDPERLRARASTCSATTSSSRSWSTSSTRTSASRTSRATCCSTTARPATSARSRSRPRCSSARGGVRRVPVRRSSASARRTRCRTSSADVDVPFDELILPRLPPRGLLAMILGRPLLAQRPRSSRRAAALRDRALHFEAPATHGRRPVLEAVGAAFCATRRRRASSRGSKRLLSLLVQLALTRPARVRARRSARRGDR